MKPQKKAVVARKAASTTPATAKKRRTSPEKIPTDSKREKKSEEKKTKRSDVGSQPRKNEKPEDPRKKVERGEERKKIEKTEDEKRAEKAEEKPEEQRKSEEKKKIEKPEDKKRLEKPDAKRKQNKDHDRKLDKTEDRKKADRNEDKEEEGRSETNESLNESLDRKKTVRAEEKNREKIDDKKKSGKSNEEDSAKSLVLSDEVEKVDGKVELVETTSKKKVKAEGKKEARATKAEKSVMSKDKKVQRKKPALKDTGRKLSPVRTKKETKVKQSLRKSKLKKTVLVKKIAARMPVTKKLIEKKIKLVKKLKNGDVKKLKKKPATKSKVGEKTPKLAKQMKARVPRKYTKMNKTLKKDDKMKKLTEKLTVRKKMDKSEAPDKEESGTSAEEPEAKNIKRELDESKEEEKSNGEVSQAKAPDPKKPDKSPAKTKVVRKIVKKSAKTPKVTKVESDQKSTTSEDVTLDELLKQSKIIDDACKLAANAKQEENALGRIVLKEENVEKNKSPIPMTTDAEDEEDQDAPKKTKRKILKKKDRKSPSSDERARRMRLFGFWSGPKRHRVASLNALAKVHCLYENEAGGVYLGGFCKPKPDKEKQKKSKEDKEDEKEKKETAAKKAEVKTEENPSHRQLRTVPGLRGKHWDMIESSSTSSSSADEIREQEKIVEPGKKKITKRRKKKEEVMDLKDMVVSKRMASLNATAMLAASYSDEKNRGGSSSIDSSSESEVEVVKRRKQTESDAEKRKAARQGSDPDEAIKSPKKVVIVNQDTDVTITGVYVNQTRSTHHEGFCSIAGMQYRISSTSHTQTAATAVATEIHDQPKPEQPCKSYTPLGALSSMQPPGSQGPPHPPVSPRRHSAFSAPHQHGYYQPAGPLIQHPPTLPPVKGPPPEPTPTPPQNSEGSDDLVATSTTSGGTTSGGTGGGGFYRTYCPPYYGTPPQYQELCYPPTYSHPHPHPPPYYKYAPTYRRQYYGYQESGVPGGGGPGGGGAGNGPGVVDYQPPPPPAEYPPPPYYGGYPPPPPPPPPPNPAYMHPQGRPFVDHAAFQGCPCPMQSCPKNVDTGPLIGNGKGAPVASGPGLSLPPSALVGPPSPARGLAGLAPPHGANAWDTDRVQINSHRNLTQNQPPPQKSHDPSAGYNRSQGSDCRTKDEKNCQGDKLRKCSCQKQAGTSRCEVKTEALSPSEKLSTPSCPSSKLRDFKLENNNVKCESCSVEVSENLSCAANCNVKCESGYKCEILKCEQCMKENQIGILEIDKDSGILLIDEKLDGEGVKEELNDVVVVENENWKKPDYEPTVQENVEEKEDSGERISAEEKPKCQKVAKRKLSLDSLSDGKKKRKVNKRTLSVGSVQDLSSSDASTKLAVPEEAAARSMENIPETVIVAKKKQTKKELQSQKRKAESANSCAPPVKKPKSSKPLSDSNGQNGKQNASETSIIETINSVIQQSVQMTQKKQRKSKSAELTEKKKKKGVNLLSTIKKVSKKFDSVKAMVSQKLNVSKQTEVKDSYSVLKSDIAKVRISEPKLKAQEAKSKVKVKSKIPEAKSRAQEAKPKVQESKSKVEVCKRSETVSKAKLSEVIGNMLSCGDVKKPATVNNRRKSTKKLANKKISGKSEDSAAVEENLELIRKPCLKPKWSNGWSWEGQPYETKVYLTNEESAIRRCYASMRHVSGDVLRPRDCVLLKSGPRKADLPFVAKIAALWENPDDGEMMFSLLWYYRPEHTEQGRTQYDTEDEVFASRHRDANSVACIEDKCYILTFNEYCRFRKNLRRIEEGLESPGLIVPPGDQVYPRECRQPPIPVPSDMVLFCRRVYDYRGKKLVKNPG